MTLGLERRYATAVIDPPWNVKAGSELGGNGFSGSHDPSRPVSYSTMSVPEMAALPVGEIMLPDAHLYLWTINRFVEEAFGLLRAWGFTYSTLIVWRKKLMGGGLGGTWRISTEFVLFARRGNLPSSGTIAGTCFDEGDDALCFAWKRPYDHRGKPHHSAKPPSLCDLVESVSPGPYVELFARQPRLGWDSHGFGYERRGVPA